MIKNQIFLAFCPSKKQKIEYKKFDQALNTNYIRNMWLLRNLTFSLLLLPIATHAFSDITPADPHRDIFSHLQEVRIMGALQDGGFHPEKTLTRAEALTIALRSGDISIPSEFSMETLPFTDVDPNSWYAPSIARAVSLKMISTHQDQFRPLDTVTKAEYLALLFRTTLVDFRPYQKKVQNISLDVNEDHWFAPTFAYAKKFQIAHLPPDRLYRPHKYLNRREGAVMAFRQLKLFHGTEVTYNFVELQAQIQQFITLLRAGESDKAEFHLQRIMELQSLLARTKNNEDAVAARSLSLAMQHFAESLKYFQYKKNLSALEHLHLAAKQTERAQAKSETLAPFAKELSGLIDETLVSFTHPNYRMTAR